MLQENNAIKPTLTFNEMCFPPCSLCVGLKLFGGKSLKLQTRNLDIIESHLGGPGLRKP